jgi:TatA/E family protein of Tat protein translocase
LLDKPSRLTYHSDERLTVFSGGFEEIGFLLFVAYLLFGPKKLPEIARTLGKGLGELRRASSELKSSLEQEIANLDRPEHLLNADREPSPHHVHDDPEPADKEPVTRS